MAAKLNKLQQLFGVQLDRGGFEETKEEVGRYKEQTLNFGVPIRRSRLIFHLDAISLTFRGLIPLSALLLFYPQSKTHRYLSKPVSMW